MFMIQTLDKYERARLTFVMLSLAQQKNTPRPRHVETQTMIWNINKNLIALRNGGVLGAMIVMTLLAGSLSAARHSQTFEQKLQRKVSVTWQGQQLVLALERLASTGQITLWLDRRVDHQQTVTLQCVDLPLVQVLEKIAQQQSLGFARLDRIIFLGPEQTALELPTLIRQARVPLANSPAAIRKFWLRKKNTTWSRLSEPRTLAESWLREANVSLNGSEQIPHDLWPAQSLPPLALVDRLVLLLSGFDLTCQIASDGKRCEIVPITRPLKLVRQRPGQKSPPRNSTQGASHKRFTLRLENQPLGRVLDQFAKQLQLEIVWAFERKQVKERLVSCEVQNIELDELLQSLLSPAGLQHHRDGKRVTIQTKSE